jgi:hypothetical protein
MTWLGRFRRLCGIRSAEDIAMAEVLNAEVRRFEAGVEKSLADSRVEFQACLEVFSELADAALKIKGPPTLAPIGKCAYCDARRNVMRQAVEGQHG